MEERYECPDLGIDELIPGRIVVFDNSHGWEEKARKCGKRTKLGLEGPVFMTVTAVDLNKIELRAGGIGNLTVIPIAQLESLDGYFYNAAAWYSWQSDRMHNEKLIVERQLAAKQHDADLLTEILKSQSKFITPEQAKKLGITE